MGLTELDQCIPVPYCFEFKQVIVFRAANLEPSVSCLTVFSFRNFAELQMMSIQKKALSI